ncbi:MAG: Hsp20 family protein [bacterium]
MVRKEIASYLRKYREKTNTTQGDLADLLGISRQSVISLESGRCIPSVALALRVSRLFEMPVEFIFRSEESDDNEESEKNTNSPDGEGNGGVMNKDLMPWSPLREIMSMRETMDKFFDESNVRAAGVFHPSVSIRETEKNLIVEADLPGVLEDDVEVEIENDKLVIKGERKHKVETKREDYYHMESSFGSFSRMVSLPGYVDSSKAEAEFTDGVLEVKVPKIQEKKSKKLTIKKSEKKSEKLKK